MKTLEIVGYKRGELGTKSAKQIRAEGSVPCVLYGEMGENVHFYAPAILFRDLVYTSEAWFVKLNVEGDTYEAILQDIQFHPVSEMITHADFLQLIDGKPVSMDIPVNITGQAPGVLKGGVLYVKNKKLTVKALPKDMPEVIDVDVSKLELGKVVKVGDISKDGFDILNKDQVTVVQLVVPRALKSATAVEGEEGELEEGAVAEGAEGGSEGEGGSAPAAESGDGETSA